MIWKPKTIPTFNSDSLTGFLGNDDYPSGTPSIEGNWTETTYTTRGEFSDFLDSCWGEPGKYGFNDTYLWREPALKFQKDGRFCDFEEGTESYKRFWAFEKKKIGQGIIVNGRYIPGEYYFYLNYTPIMDAIKGTTDFPDAWDSDYHFYLYCWRANIRNLNAGIVKARRKGLEQPNSELILTNEGFKPFSDLNVGTLVATPNGTYTPVVDIYEHPNKDVYEVTFMDGRKVKCGLEHLWTVYDKRALKNKTLNIETLLEIGISSPTNKGKNVAYRFAVPDIEPVEYPSQDLPIDPYILGCLLGDGVVKNSLKICNPEEYILDRFREIPGYHLVRDEYSEVNWRITTDSCFDKVAQEKYGKKSHSKFIPEIYKRNSIENRLEIIRGLMDTDGSISADGDMTLSSTSKELMEDFVEVLRSLGVKVRYSFRESKKSNHRGIYRAYIKTTRYNLFNLPRKSEKFKQGKEIYSRVPIVDIQKLGYKEDSRCIYIDTPDHLYLTRDFIPTHNSLKCTSRLTRNLWFIANSVSKMIAYEDDYINEKGSWKFMVTYRDFLNTHTPWYRVFEPDESSNWEQKETVVEGTHNKKKRIKGLRSKVMAATAKKNPSKTVGGSIYEMFCEEAGVFPNLDKVLEFADAATKMGGVKTGFVVVSGAVGELKDCKPLENIALKPEVNGFLGVDDIFSEVPSGEKICFFLPDYWNYITEVDGQTVKCFDIHGNSDIELAQKLLLQEEEVMKKKDTYTLWKSQHPWNLQDAFAIREENIWPTKIIKDHQQLVRATYSPLCVDIIPDESDKSKLTHKISTWKPVNTLRVDPMKDNRGVVEIDELPVDNPKWGLYYAGVDPIRSTNTTTSRSLMSVYIWKATHMRDGKVIQDYPVARYTGRFYTWEETYETCMNLIKYYNARVAVESNVSSFTEWAISKGYGHYFMHRKEIHILNEMMPNSTITNEIGIRMEGVFKEKAMDFGVTYVDEVISVYDKEVDGEKEKVFVYGVQRLKDVMLMEEMLKFNPKLNTDRIIAFVLGLMAARSNTNRSLIVHEDASKDHRTSRQIQPTLRLNSNLSRITLTNHFTKR